MSNDSTLAALTDRAFEANKASHIEKVRHQWATGKTQVIGVAQHKIIDNALDERLGQDRTVNETLEVTRKLEFLIHGAALSHVQQWWILRNGLFGIYDTPAARTVNETYNCCIIAQAVCRREPTLAFQCQDSKPPIPYAGELASRCPFEHAVELENDISAVSCMLENLWTFLNQENPETSRPRLHSYLIGCQGPDQNGEPKFNPLSAALEKGKLLLAELLMQYDLGLATESIICACLAKINKDANETQLHDSQVQVLKYLMGRRPDLKTRNTLSFATETRRADLVSLFFRHDLFTHEAAVTIIKYNEKDLWDIPNIQEAFTTYKPPNGGPPSDLLHLAVLYGCVEIVDHLAETTDGAVQLDAKQRYPLYYNRHGLETTAIGRKASDVSTGARSAPERPTLLNPDQIENEGEHHRSVSVGAGARDQLSDAELSEPRKRIRTALVKQIIQKCRPSTMYEIARACAETFGQTSLDLKALNASRFSFTDLVESLTLPGDSVTDLRKTLQFEPILRYVDIPTLPSRPEDIGTEHNDIDRLLAWLKDKKVEKIVELDILDRLWGSHSQKCISKWLSYFQVSVVNWRCPDFGLAKLDEIVRNQLTSLHLYSSGNEAIEDHWFGPSGFDAMQKLTFVRITVVEELMYSAMAIEVERRLKALVASYYARRSRALAVLDNDEGRLNTSTKIRARGYSAPTNPAAWAPGWKWPRIKIQVDRRRVYEMGERLPAHGLQQIGNLAIEELDAFLQSYRGINIIERKATRIAILDNGVMLPDAYNIHAGKRENRENRESGEGQESIARPRSSIADRIVEGESFVHGSYGRLSSWLVASNPHGTQMANLICATDPKCHILVAKVGEHKNDVSPSAVEKAIRWAIEKKVDVISMSFAIYQSTNELKKAIEAAYAANIVLIASTHDEGSNANEAFPAGYTGQTIAIAATNDFGSTLTYTPNENQFNFRVKGVNVFAGTVPYLVSEERISGSSVATAIAAGLASLILSCHYISGYKEPERDTWKTELVNFYMKEMVPHDAPSAPKYVSLKKFADLDKQDLKTTVNAEKKIKEWFIKTKTLKDKPVQLSRA